MREESRNEKEKEMHTVERIVRKGEKGDGRRKDKKGEGREEE